MSDINRDRINRILNHDYYNENVKLNEKAEAGREYCHHDMSHFLDVARIAQILNLEEAQHVELEWIYAAALLHDIGRHVQYENGTPHEAASAELAEPILADCGFDVKEAEEILNAIKNHRTASQSAAEGLSGLLYRADKLSRSCFACKVQERCNWKNDKKNMFLIW